MASSWARRPTLYVELIGNGLFAPFTLEYAPKAERFRHIISRLRKISDLTQTGERQLSNVPDAWIRVAAEENQGNLDLIDHTLAPACPEELKGEFDSAAASARDALRRFQNFLTQDLPKRRRRRGDGEGQPDWRLGPSTYNVKFKLALVTDRTADEVLKDAETRLGEVRRNMAELARPLHASMFPSHGEHAELPGDQGCDGENERWDIPAQRVS